jgi:hypothetical protein
MTGEQPNRQSICTLFDHRYMGRALVMINSVRRFSGDMDVWALCLNGEALEGMGALNLAHVKLVTLGDLESSVPGVAQARTDREPIEFYYACMPALHRYVFDRDPAVQASMYVDSDIKFFGDPNGVFDKFKDASAAITPHAFPERLRHNEKFGVYNAGWTAFRRTPNGENCLNWWLERSLEWSSGYIDEQNDRFANQRYVNRFNKIIPDVTMLDKGCNLAPWNIENYVLSERNGRVFVDENPLYFFHFHGVRKSWKFFYFDNHRLWKAPYTKLMRHSLYRPYVAELVEMEKVVSRVVPVQPKGVVPLRGATVFGIDFKNMGRGVRSAAYKLLDLAEGRAILEYGSRTL